MIDKLNEDNGVLLQGHTPRYLTPTNGEVIVDKRNAIDENMSISLKV